MDFKIDIQEILESIHNDDKMSFNCDRLYNVLESSYNVLKDKLIEDLDKILESDMSYEKKIKYYTACYHHQVIRLRQHIISYCDVLQLVRHPEPYLLEDYNALLDEIDINRKLIIDANHFYKRNDLLNPN